MHENGIKTKENTIIETIEEWDWNNRNSLGQYYEETLNEGSPETTTSEGSANFALPGIINNSLAYSSHSQYNQALNNFIKVRFKIYLKWLRQIYSVVEVFLLCFYIRKNLLKTKFFYKFYKI